MRLSARSLRVRAICCLLLAVSPISASCKEEDRDTFHLELRFDDLPRAAEALDEVWVRPWDPVPRVLLVELYEETGYSAVAEFFRASVESLATGRVEPRRFDRRLRQYPAAAAENDYQRAEEITDLIVEGKYKEAIDVAEESFSSLGVGPQTALAWSEATLIQGAIAPSQESLEDKEKALRLFITLTLSNRSSPISATSVASALEYLSRLLTGIGDLPSAYIAAVLSMEELSRHEDVEKWERDAHTQRVNEIVERFNSEFSSHHSPK